MSKLPHPQTHPTKLQDNQYVYLPTNYFHKMDSHGKAKSINTLAKGKVEPAVVSDFDSSVYRNQITELAKENHDLRNRIERLNYDNMILNDSLHNTKLLSEKQKRTNHQ